MSRHHRSRRWGGSAVTRAREAWAPLVATATLDCPICGQPLANGEAWDLGHRVPLSEGGDPIDYRPEHAACNRREGGIIGNQHRKAQTQRTRRWT